MRKKGDTVFYVSAHNMIVKAKVLCGHRDGSAKVEACFFVYDGGVTGQGYIGSKYELASTELFVSALAADYEIQSRRGLTL